MTTLQVLLVDDEPADLESYKVDLPAVFAEFGIEPVIHAYGDFAIAFDLAEDPLYRFDMIISDTYRGKTQNNDAAVLELIAKYKKNRRFCPLVVFSSGVKPEDLKESAFLAWADKAADGSIEAGIRAVLTTGVPQLAHTLHDELDYATGDYLWGFLEKEWERITQFFSTDTISIERLIRRRAAIQMADLLASEADRLPIAEIDAVEHYFYPAINPASYSLGEIVRSKESGEFRVLLTPHCHLMVQEGNDEPRAEFVLTVIARAAKDVLGVKYTNAVELEEDRKKKKLDIWSRRPSHQDVGTPEGRYWYLPAFLDIPHMFCDFMCVESIPYKCLRENFDSVAVLAAPFAESLQSCFLSYYSSIGLPKIRYESVSGMLKKSV